MSANRKCRGCGADVPANAPFGHCPKCLLDLGFGTGTSETTVSSELKATGSSMFGEYELLEQIGRGGMGIVYKARQVALNRPVALKMISAGEFASPILIERFHREAEAAANLNHPNIVPIYETGEIHGQHYLSMALIEGMGLDAYIKRTGVEVGLPEKGAHAFSRMREEDTARVLAKVARAVDHAHQHGVLHRDLKPSNIIVDRNGEPHLTDFGVAKVLGRGDSSLTASGAIVGTPSYMAPEQAAGQSKHTTTAADVYSLGAILYALLTGVPPFRGDTPVETLRQVVEQEPKPPSTLREGIDSDLATIAMKCLEKEPQRRYSSASALAEDLERWLRKEPIQARSVQAIERFWRWCRRNPGVATLSGAVALLMLALSMGSVIVALRINALNDDKDGKNREFRNLVFPSLAKLYSDEGDEPVVISSSTRRALFDKRLRPLGDSPLELLFVEHIYEHPTNMLATLAPIFDELEDELSRLSGKPVAIHMRLVRSPAETYAAMQLTNAVIGRMGPSSVVFLEKQNSGTRLLAMQNHTKPLTVGIFTHTNSQVARLANSRPGIALSALLANAVLALTHSNSTTGNFLAKWFLVSKGVYATNFLRYTYEGAQRRALDAVAAGRCDVGAGNLDLIDNYPAIRVLEKFPVPNLGRCWVGGKNLDPKIEADVRNCLFALTDPGILRKLESDVSGFKMPDETALERLREMMNGAAAFDAVKRR